LGIHPIRIVRTGVPGFQSAASKKENGTAVDGMVLVSLFSILPHHCGRIKQVAVSTRAAAVSLFLSSLFFIFTVIPSPAQIVMAVILAW